MIGAKLGAGRAWPPAGGVEPERATLIGFPERAAQTGKRMR
jgi:hypothetical protein